MKKKPAGAHLPKTAGRAYHIGLAPGDAAPNILLCGDPARARRTAEEFDSVRGEWSHREYVTLTGAYHGIPVSVMATGMGPDNTEIAVVELCQVVQDPLLIRIGSCGALQRRMRLGDLVVTSAALRLENTSLAFVPEGYPAAAHHEVVLAILRAAADLKTRHHLGITATAPGFYGYQGRRIPGFPSRKLDLPEELARIGVANFEMEASALLTLASVRGLRAGCVCAVYANRHHDEFISETVRRKAEGNCFRTGLRSIEVLAAMDRARGRKPHFLPDV